MKYFSSIALLLLIGFMVTVPTTAEAAFNPFLNVCLRDGADESAVCNETQSGDPISGSDGVLISVANIIALVAGMAAVILIIVSGIKFVTSSGDSNGVSSAKKTIAYALVGLVVIILARTIVVFIVRRI